MRFLDWGSWHHNCQLRLWEFDRLLPGVHGKDVSLFEVRGRCFNHHDYHHHHLISELSTLLVRHLGTLFIPFHRWRA